MESSKTIYFFFREFAFFPQTINLTMQQFCKIIRHNLLQTIYLFFSLQHCHHIQHFKLSCIEYGMSIVLHNEIY